ncbi:MAG: glycerate kinase type-2 family protein [Nitrosopumilaceae archaeon]
MIIKNFRNIALSADKKIVLNVLEAGLLAAMPEATLKKIIRKKMLIVDKNHIHLSKYKRIFVIGFGKASDYMLTTVNLLTDIDGGIIVIPEGTNSILKNKKFEIIHAGHPVPNKKSVQAGKKILEFIKTRKKTDLIIFLISGGGSSLVSLPDEITLNDKQIMTNLLLKSGANIHEINCVRKHLSKIKGGRMSEYLVCNAVSLVMSDVVGDDLSVIASGPTYFDNTTYRDAEKILQKYNLQKFAPKSVLQRIRLGVLRKIPDTPKRQKIKNYIIATNKDCLTAMAEKARGFGLSVKDVYPITGEAKSAAKKLLKIIPKKTNSCLIFGGETTVRVVGNGRGGRNQELVLYCLTELQNMRKKITIASIDTDGKDGNTNAAGAIMNNSKFESKNINRFLHNNDSYHFFKKYHGLIITGPTHTNLMDIGVMLIS